MSNEWLTITTAGGDTWWDEDAYPPEEVNLNCGLCGTTVATFASMTLAALIREATTHAAVNHPTSSQVAA